MKLKRRRSPGKPRVSPTLLEHINPNVAGIDCGSAEHFVAVPSDRDPTPVRAFSTFTTDLLQLAAWLTACRVTSVAMEATGVYWIPISEILEARGVEVLLVNARHFKHVPGRKSDVSDCEWLRELHSVGLLRGSFRPTAGIVALRTYLRHRQTLVETASTFIQRMQKALVEMNLQLPLVVSDITGGDWAAHFARHRRGPTRSRAPRPASRAELREALRTSAGLATIWRELNQLDLTVRKTVHADEQPRPDVAAQRRQWRDTLTLRDAGRYVFLDGCAVTTDLLRRYGRSPRGTRLHDHTPCSHWQTHTVVAGLRPDALTRPRYSIGRSIP